VHWLAYLAWPVAFLHSLTAGNDLGIWWVALIEVGSAVAVATAVLARLFGRARAGGPRGPGGPARALLCVNPRKMSAASRAGAR
jgi:sulfoxide reductase heme-binding subunit YedZ